MMRAATAQSSKRDAEASTVETSTAARSRRRVEPFRLAERASDSGHANHECRRLLPTRFACRAIETSATSTPEKV